jgi:hypothetical protein
VVQLPEGRRAVPRPEVKWVVRPAAARPVVSRRVQAVAARPDVPDGSRREHLKAQHPARLSAAAARMVRALQATEEPEAMVAQRLAQAERLAPQVLRGAGVAAVREAQSAPQVAAVRPTAVPGEVAAPDVAVGRQPGAEASAGAARRREAAAVQGAAAVQRRAAGPASVAVRLQVAEALDAVAVPLRVAEAPDAEVRQPAARGGAVRPSAAAWAGLPSTRCRGDRPAPSARVAHARGCLRTARR